MDGTVCCCCCVEMGTPDLSEPLTILAIAALTSGLVYDFLLDGLHPNGIPGCLHVRCRLGPECISDVVDNISKIVTLLICGVFILTLLLYASLTTFQGEITLESRVYAVVSAVLLVVVVVIIDVATNTAAVRRVCYQLARCVQSTCARACKQTPPTTPMLKTSSDTSSCWSCCRGRDEVQYQRLRLGASTEEAGKPGSSRLSVITEEGDEVSVDPMLTFPVAWSAIIVTHVATAACAAIGNTFDPQRANDSLWVQVIVIGLWVGSAVACWVFYAAVVCWLNTYHGRSLEEQARVLIFDSLSLDQVGTAFLYRWVRAAAINDVVGVAAFVLYKFDSSHVGDSANWSYMYLALPISVVVTFFTTYCAFSKLHERMVDGTLSRVRLPFSKPSTTTVRPVPSQQLSSSRDDEI